MDTPSRPSASFVTPPESAAAGLPSALMTPRFVRVLAVQFAFGFSFSIYFLMPKYLTTVFAADAGVIGLVGATPLLASVLASPFIGTALDAMGRRPLMLAGSALGVVTSVGMLTVDSIGPWLYTLRLLQGVGFALVFNAAAAIVADLAPAERLGHAMGLLGAASLITNAIAPAAAEAVAHVWGWAPVFAGAAAMAAASFALGLGVDLTERRPLARLSAGSTQGEVRRFLYVGAMMGAAFGTLITFTQPFALEQGTERVAGFFVGYTVAALSIRLSLGNVADRIGRMRVARIALAAYGVVTLATAFLRPGWLEVFGLAFGAAHGLLYPSLAALVAERCDPARRGRWLTAFNAAFNGGCGVSLLGSGLIAARFGYPLVFVLTGVATLASVGLLARRA